MKHQTHLVLHKGKQVNLKKESSNLSIRPQLFKRWIALYIHRINHYPLDNSIDFASVYPLDT